MADEATPAAARPAQDSTAHVRRLVERGPAGRPRALEELYLLHFDRIYSYLHMSVGNRHDAEDLTTQTFLKMLGVDQAGSGGSRRRSRRGSSGSRTTSPMDHFRATRRWQPEEEVPEPTGESEPSAEAAALQSIGRQSMLELIDGALDRAAAGADAQVRLQPARTRDVATILEQDRGCGQVASAPRARRRCRSRSPQTGSLACGARGRDRRAAELRQDDAVHARSRTRRRGRPADVGMAAIPDARLDAARRRRSSRAKVTPAAIRVVEVRGHGAGAAREPAPGRCAARRARRLLGHARFPRDDLGDAAARAARRRPGPRRAAARARREAGEVGRRRSCKQEVDGARAACWRTLDAGGTARRLAGRAAAGLEPLTTKPLIAVENGPDGIDLKLEAELAELSDEDAAAFREGRVRARGSRAPAQRRARTDHVLHRGRQGDARVDAARRARRRSTAAETIHTDIARGFIRAEVIRWERPRRGRFTRGGRATRPPASRG